MHIIIDSYKMYFNKIYKWIEDRRTFIPFSNAILGYLRLPLVVRILLFSVGVVISHHFFFNIGYIISQSKARNEVLSLVTAYHNPVDLPDTLYYLYAFIYLFVFMFTVLPILILTFGVEWIFDNKLKASVANIQDNKNKLIKYALLIFIWILMSLLVIIFITEIVPLLPYYLLHASKNSAFLEMIFKSLLQNEGMTWVDESYTIDTFQSELFITLQLGNILMTLLIFIIYFYMKHHRRFEKNHKYTQQLYKLVTEIALFADDKYDFFVKNATNSYRKLKLGCYRLLFGLSMFVFVLAIGFVFVSHTAHQVGSFGKSLTRFETDLVEVSYVFNDKVVSITGFRVFQNKGYIVLRSDDGRIHHIESEQVELRTVLPEK